MNSDSENKAQGTSGSEQDPNVETVTKQEPEVKDEGRKKTSMSEEVEQKPKAEKTKKQKKDSGEEQPPVQAKEVERAAAVDEILASIKKMTVLELSQLVKALESEFGVSAAAQVLAAPTSNGASEAAAKVEEEEKTEFNVILKDMGANKISVIKVVRELTTLGLKESKDLVESAPKPVREGVTKDEAATMKEKLEAAGAAVEIN